MSCPKSATAVPPNRLRQKNENDRVATEEAAIVSSARSSVWSVTYSFEMKRSLLTFLPCWPFANRGVSVHISFAFSRTMLQ